MDTNSTIKPERRIKMPYKPNFDKALEQIATGDGKTEAEQFLKCQANRQLKNSNKKIIEMSDVEKELYAEMNKKEIEAYEKQFIKEGDKSNYLGETNVFFSPLASSILDTFFTDGKH